ncbi:MAG: hypothetical protein RL591_2289 [Planctomycetota bacterium]
MTRIPFRVSHENGIRVTVLPFPQNACFAGSSVFRRMGFGAVRRGMCHVLRGPPIHAVGSRPWLPRFTSSSFRSSAVDISRAAPRRRTGCGSWPSFASTADRRGGATLARPSRRLPTLLSRREVALVINEIPPQRRPRQIRVPDVWQTNAVREPAIGTDDVRWDRVPHVEVRTSTVPMALDVHFVHVSRHRAPVSCALALAYSTPKVAAAAATAKAQCFTIIRDDATRIVERTLRRPANQSQLHKRKRPRAVDREFVLTKRIASRVDASAKESQTLSVLSARVHNRAAHRNIGRASLAL